MSETSHSAAFSFVSSRGLHLCRMSVSTRGQDVLNCVVDALELFNVPMEKIFSVTTDGAPAITGKINGFTTYVHEMM